MHKISKEIIAAIERGNKILVCGNGGSATMSSHFVGELVGKFEKERKPLPAVSLVDNIASLTAIANDYSYDQVFSRQLEAIGNEGDILITLSTSGRSVNCLEAEDKARLLDINVIRFPVRNFRESTADCQERHLKLIHRVSREVENHFYESN